MTVRTVLHGLILVLSASLVAVAPLVAFVLFALGGGPLPLLAVGFGIGATVRWSHIGVQLGMLLLAIILQSVAYYLLATGIPRGQLLGESVGLAALSAPFGLAALFGGRWFGEHVLWRQFDVLRHRNSSIT